MIVERNILGGAGPPWVSLDALGLLSKFEENAMDDEVFRGLCPLGSPGLPQVSLALRETCRKCLKKGNLSGEARPLGLA